MEKKLIASACMLTAVIVSVIILRFFALPKGTLPPTLNDTLPSTPEETLPPPTLPIDTTISEIVSNPEAWVNRTVRVEGKLVGPMVYIPEAHPPWNYELFKPNATVETIGSKETIHIGVVWNGGENFAMDNVTTTGVVREGQTSSYGHIHVCYYINAKGIEI